MVPELIPQKERGAALAGCPSPIVTRGTTPQTQGSAPGRRDLDSAEQAALDGALVYALDGLAARARACPDEAEDLQRGADELRAARRRGGS